MKLGQVKAGASLVARLSGVTLWPIVSCGTRFPCTMLRRIVNLGSGAAWLGRGKACRSRGLGIFQFWRCGWNHWNFFGTAPAWLQTSAANMQDSRRFCDLALPCNSRIRNAAVKASPAPTVSITSVGIPACTLKSSVVNNNAPSLPRVTTIILSWPSSIRHRNAASRPCRRSISKTAQTVSTSSSLNFKILDS